MAPLRKTPGVYVVEQSAFPSSIAEVATAVPGFIGYTQISPAPDQDQDQTVQPVRITSLSEYQDAFGAGPDTLFVAAQHAGRVQLTPAAHTQFYLYRAMRLFFDNGGQACWVASAGVYSKDGTAQPVTRTALESALSALEHIPEVTMIAAPDAMLLTRDDAAAFAQKTIAQCAALASRVALLDVWNGSQPRSGGDEDVIDGTHGFRASVGQDGLSYAAAYYPWVNASVLSASEVDFTMITPDSLSVVQDAVQAEAARLARTTDSVSVRTAKAFATPPETRPETRVLHNALIARCPLYDKLMQDMLAQLNLLPPSAALAGVICRTDHSFGVWKAPANTGLMSVVSPCVEVSPEDQDDLNAPAGGKSINAIRSFDGRGPTVWGARTLDGNAPEWRYIHLRRTAIMLEQSIRSATQAYAFAPNTAATWSAVKSTTENFLNSQWKSGALVGATPNDAYDVAVGLGTTMTAEDVQDGYMIISVRVAQVRPAEFTVLTIRQKMQAT